MMYARTIELFKGILNDDPEIQGRFHVCPKYGAEINSDELNEVLSEIVPRPMKAKYPLVLMMPPTCSGSLSSTSEPVRFNATLFFLTTLHYGHKAVVNPATGTSMRPITDVWDDMLSVVMGFHAGLDALMRQGGGKEFRHYGNTAITQPVSFIGTDRAAGIRTQFDYSLFNDC